MKKIYIVLIGFLGVFGPLQAMDKIAGFFGISSRKQPQEKKLAKELTNVSFNIYLNQLKNDVGNQDLQSIIQHFVDLYKATNKFNVKHDQVQTILGHAADIIYPYANQIITSGLNRDQKLDILSSLAFIFINTAYYEKINQAIKTLLAQAPVGRSIEPAKKSTPLGYLERKTKEAMKKQNVAALQHLLEEAKEAKALLIQKDIKEALKKLQEKLVEEQTEFYKEEPKKYLESEDDDEFISYIQNTIRQAKWSGEKFNELRDILGTLETDHPYYKKVKKAITDIKAQKVKQ